MIFRTIKDEATGANQSIGLFKPSTINESDIKYIERYNELIKSGVKDQAQLEQATKGASDATKQMIKNANGNTIALDKMTLGAKAASVGLKALSVAGNIFLGMAISWGISKIVEGIDNLHDTEKELAEMRQEIIDTAENISLTLYIRLNKHKITFVSILYLNAKKDSKRQI